MKCPQCLSSFLGPVELEHGLVGAGCERCQGVLLPMINFRYWIDTTGRSIEAEEESESQCCEDQTGAKLCPKCSKLMTKYRISLEVENRIELCANCDEAWLDKGEWKLLKRLDLYAILPELFTDSWQKKIRMQRQEEHWRKHFFELIGDDFSRVEQFKKWLDQHEKVADIKHYLATNFDF